MRARPVAGRPKAARRGRKSRSEPRVVRIHNGCPGLHFSRPAVARLIHLLDAHAADILSPSSSAGRLHPVPPGELSLALLTAPALARLHASFLRDASPTDVITFFPPAPGPARAWTGPVGEICVSADAARAFAAAHQRDFSEELTVYVVHGWLHLAGHDDRQPAARKRMRAAERRALQRLRTAGKIPHFALTAPPRA